MGSNVRRRERICFDGEDDEEPQCLADRIKACLRSILEQLPCYIPHILVGIASVMLAFYVHTQYQRHTIKAIYSSINELRECMTSRLDDIEKAVMRLAVSCGASVGSEDEGDPTEELIKKYIRKYDADKTGMIDWALESLGGKVIGVKGTESYVLGGSSVLGLPCTKYTSDPSTIIRPSTMPGDCWAFRGEGTVLVKLVTSVYVTNFTLEHIAQEMSPYGEITSAPKIFVVYGSPDPAFGEGSRHCFGHYEYKSDGDTVQTFPVQNPSYAPYDIVEFNFKSNHGNHDFTCVYRIRVHGRLNMNSFSL